MLDYKHISKLLHNGIGRHRSGKSEGSDKSVGAALSRGIPPF